MPPQPLRVVRLDLADVYRDLVRVPETFRRYESGKTVPESTICKVTVEGRSILVSARGWDGQTEPTIRMDDKTRNALGVAVGRDYSFEFREASLLEKLSWAWNSSDPTPRIAARIGVVSLGLGALGAILGLVGVGLGLLSLKGVGR